MKVPDGTMAGTPHKDLWLQMLALRWPLALACAAVLPFALPLPGNPITLAAFVAFIGGAVLVSSVRWLIVFLPVFSALGPYFLETYVAGINLFGFRMLIIVLAVFSTPLTSRSEWWFNPVARYTILFVTFWIVSGTLSLLWTPDPEGGLVEILSIVFGGGLVLALFNLRSHTQANLDMLRFGWVFALLVVLSQATYELFTGYHLPSFKSEPWDTYLDGSVLQSTLGHPGGFASFLLLTTPFLLWSMERSRGVEKFLYIGLLAATGFFAMYGGARNSFVALMLEFAVYFVILERRWYLRWAAVACGVVAAVALTNLFMQGDSKLAQKYQSASEKGLEEGSIGERITLSLNGIWMAIETGGIGVGADGYREVIASGETLLPLRAEKRGMLKPAHNFWVEVLAEYGIAPFLGLMGLLGWVAYLGYRAHRGRGRRDPEASMGRAILVGLVGYAFYGIQAGTVTGLTENWMFLASLSVLAAFLYDAERQRQLSHAAADTPRHGLSDAPARYELWPASQQRRMAGRHARIAGTNHGNAGRR
jgi:teichuronic acid biosynthesis protein TuaE